MRCGLTVEIFASLLNPRGIDRYKIVYRRMPPATQRSTYFSSENRTPLRAERGNWSDRWPEHARIRNGWPRETAEVKHPLSSVDSQRDVPPKLPKIQPLLLLEMLYLQAKVCVLLTVSSMQLASAMRFEVYLSDAEVHPVLWLAKLRNVSRWHRSSFYWGRPRSASQAPTARGHTRSSTLLSR